MCCGQTTASDARQFPSLGRDAKSDEIAAWDIAVGPLGEELPNGVGSVGAGREIYAAQCAHCHGANGTEGPDPRLVGGQGSLDGPEPLLTVGSFWPYATTLFDYINRAMPFLAPGSLKPDEVYAVTAFLLYANGIIAEDSTLDKHNLSTIKMPNRNGFDPDPRPESFSDSN